MTCVDIVCVHLWHSTSWLIYDQLPTELPRDASIDFSRKLLPILLAWTKNKTHGARLCQDHEKHMGILRRAYITKAGKLLDEHQWLYSTLDIQVPGAELASSGIKCKETILVLGSGMVAGPAVTYLLSKGYRVIIGTHLKYNGDAKLISCRKQFSARGTIAM